jgi:DNA modification methylase
MKIIEKKIDELIPYQTNPRINDQAVKPVAESIKQFGFKVPIIIDNKNVIVCGHTRLKAGKFLKLKTVPCILADDLTEEQIKAFRLADNKVSELATWDFTLLENELKGLEDMEMFGFEESDFGDPPENEGLTDEDEIPEEVEPVCKLGQIWQLGEHRVMCGSSTEEEQVGMLLNGRQIEMVFTDPPYSVNFTKKAKEVLHSKNYVEIENDNLGVDETAETIWKPFFNISSLFSKDESSIYCTMPQGGDQMMMMMMMMMQNGWQVKHELIWVKEAPVFSMGRLDYDYKHEPIIYGWKKKHNFYGKGEFTKSVWEIPRTENKLHPTMKPTRLIANAISNSSLVGELIYDGFLGSGSTLIACEKTNRVCYGMELDPHYCDVIIKRWEQFTGKKAELILDNE